MDFLHKILDYYSCSEGDYERLLVAPSFKDLPDISAAVPVQKAIASLSETKAKKGRVLVYGDYDCDGIVSTSVIVSALLEFGIDCQGYIPSRYLDGYGISKENVSKIAKAGYSLILTVDNGVAAEEGLLRAKEENIPVIVLDHHEYDSLPSYPLSIIHPDTVGLKENPPSAGLLSYYFAKALLREECPKLLEWAGLTILSDSMDLIGYNKKALALAMSLMNIDHPLEISLLSDKCLIDENVLAMEIVPKINAVGRIKEGHEGNKVLKYFLTESKDEKIALSSFIKDTNEERKLLTKEAEKGLSIDLDEEAIVVLTDLQEGLNGLLASRLLSEYEKPVAVFSASSKDPTTLVGSLRSKEGFNILKALEATKAPLIAGGGHEFAGGCSIKKDDLPLFKKDFLFLALKHKLVKENKRSIPLEENEATMDNFYLLRSFGPFGKGNEAPCFLLSKKAEELSFSRDGRFLSTPISDKCRLFSFSLGPSSFPKKGSVELVVTFSRNEWKGKESLDLLALSLNIPQSAL